MNIRLPYSWIQDYLKTSAPPEKVFKLLTASGPTIEHFEKTKDDYLLDIEVTINRPDCLSVLGIAREMYAVLRQNNYPAKLENDFLANPLKIKIFGEKVPFKFSIDPKLCRRFCGVVLKNLKIKPSPPFIAERLEKAGMRSLNNVVDITNFLMLELGQPNHAFDFEKIKGPDFIIRPAKKGETIVTLDDQTRTLDKGDIVYEDKEKIFDLTGIMGGKASEIDSQTKTVFFTVVNLYYAQIRQTSMRLGLQTEASSRLSKTLDPEIVYNALLRGIQLMMEYADAEIGSQIYDFYPEKQKKKAIIITDSQISSVLGVSIPPRQVDRILTDLGFKVKRQKDIISSLPPNWRLNDIHLPEDLVEEVARIFNYENIPSHAPVFELPVRDQKEKLPFLLEEQARQTLVNWGLWETFSFSMVSQKDLEAVGSNTLEAIKISNPLSSDWVYMQPNLFPNLLKNLSAGQYQEPNLKIFEIANIFDKNGEEVRSLGIGQLNGSFFDLKGIIEQFLSALSLPPFIFQKSDPCLIFRQEESANILANNLLLGRIGRIKEKTADYFGLKSSAFLAEINLDLVFKLSNPIRKYQHLERFNPVIEDLSLVIPPSKPTYQDILAIMEKQPGVRKIEFLGHFANRLAFRVYYQFNDHQISSNEARTIRENLLKELDRKLKVVLYQPF